VACSAAGPSLLSRASGLRRVRLRASMLATLPLPEHASWLPPCSPSPRPAQRLGARKHASGVSTSPLRLSSGVRARQAAGIARERALRYGERRRTQHLPQGGAAAGPRAETPGSFFDTRAYQQAKGDYEAAKQERRESMLADNYIGLQGPHVAVAVDTWERDANGNYAKTGVITFSMAPDKSSVWNVAKGISWVGKGHIDELYGRMFLPDEAVITFSSTPEEDIAMLKNIRWQMSRNDTQYSALVWNCIHWSFAQRSIARELVERQVIEGLP
jgi:hypothetical protein